MDCIVEEMLLDALNEAKVVMEQATSQEQIDEAYEALLQMKKLLVDRSPLKAKLAEAGSVVELA